MAAQPSPMLRAALIPAQEQILITVRLFLVSPPQGLLQQPAQLGAINLATNGGNDDTDDENDTGDAAADDGNDVADDGDDDADEGNVVADDGDDANVDNDGVNNNGNGDNNGDANAVANNNAGGNANAANTSIRANANITLATGNVVNNANQVNANPRTTVVQTNGNIFNNANAGVLPGNGNLQGNNGNGNAGRWNGNGLGNFTSTNTTTSTPATQSATNASEQTQNSISLANNVSEKNDIENNGIGVLVKNSDVRFDNKSLGTSGVKRDNLTRLGLLLISNPRSVASNVNRGSIKDYVIPVFGSSGDSNNPILGQFTPADGDSPYKLSLERLFVNNPSSSNNSGPFKTSVRDFNLDWGIWNASGNSQKLIAYTDAKHST